MSSIGEATDEDFAKEFLDLKMSVAVVDDLDAAIAHVNRYSSGHTEAIITRDLAASERFTHEVDAAAVMVNASTRFTDGEQFGFRRRDRHLHPEAARPRPDGPARTDHDQVRRPRRRPDPELNAAEGGHSGGHGISERVEVIAALEERDGATR